LKKIVVLLLMLALFPVASFAEDDTSEKINEMIADLGNNKANNGREMKCANGGTKRITIKRIKGETSYSGVYKKCKEPGRTRDGRVSITIGG